MGWTTVLACLVSGELLRDVGNVGVFIKGYLHPSFGNIGLYGWQCVVTVCIALWGTLLAVLISVPLGLCGARNLSPHPAVYFLARRVMDLLRAVNEFVFALMFVTAVGLGPFAGMLALGPRTAEELAAACSLTPAKARRHLNRLTSAGLEAWACWRT